jgi:hypothetical protein
MSSSGSLPKMICSRTRSAARSLESRALFCQERRGVVRQRSVGPSLVIGGRVPERADGGDSLVSRTKVDSQFVDEFQRVQDADRHQGCVGVRVGG